MTGHWLCVNFSCLQRHKAMSAGVGSIDVDCWWKLSEEHKKGKLQKVCCSLSSPSRWLYKHKHPLMSEKLASVCFTMPSIYCHPLGSGVARAYCGNLGME